MPHYVKHGMTRHPVYRAWCGMVHRTDYALCSEWQSFSAFKADMLPSWRPGLRLARIDPLGEYSPTNCRWVERRNNLPRRDAVFVEYRGQTYRVPELAILAGLPYPVLATRLRRGVPVVDAVETPLQRQRKR